jgi:putative hemolysin
VRRDAESGDKKAQKLLYMIERPTKFLATIQVCITLAGLLGSAFAADSFSDPLAKWLLGLGVPLEKNLLNNICVVLITLVLAYFSLVLGELVPKRIAMKRTEAVADFAAGLIYYAGKIASPLVAFLNISTSAVLSLIGIDPNEKGETVTEEEIRAMVDASSQSGNIDPEEKAMIENIFEFNNKTVDEIMVHRTDVDFLWLEDSLDVWENTFISSNHSYLPVCGEDADDIVGILHSKKFYAARRDNVTETRDIKSYLGSPYFVPEYITINVLFKNMQKKKSRFAVVLDEYGGMSGIITMNDLLEEIVGDFDDEIEDPEINVVGEGRWRIKGTTDLESVSRATGAALPEDEDYDTLGGLIIHELKAIPFDSNVPPVEKYGLKIWVEEVKARRIEWAGVMLLETEKKEAADETAAKN